jgi:predicted Holliday junction resolvase-like endonuclease
MSTSPETFAAIILLFLGCLVFLFAGFKLGNSFGRRRERAEWEGGKLEKIVASRLKQSRAVIGGQVSEQVAPFLPGFPFDPADCRFVGKPVDFVVFRGMNEKNIAEVVFLEVKTGAAKNLNEAEKQIKAAVKAGKVGWAEFDF